MRRALLAAASLIAVGIFQAQPASAAWQDDMFGVHSNNTKSFDRSAARTSDAPRAEKPVRTARATTSDDDDSASNRRGRRSSGSGSSEGGTGAGSGMASYYWQPQRVASGGWFNPNAMTAAHKTLPFGTRVRVTNQRNGQSVEVTINDRGPFVAGRVIDLSAAAAGVINMKGAGVAPVSLTVLGR